MHYVVATFLTLFNLLMLVVVLVGLPGVWLMIVCALLVQWWRADTFSWWTLGACAVIALLAEIAEFSASALMSKAGGGSSMAATGAIVGALTGGIAGAAFPPIIGAIIWSVVGAGIGAIVGEVASGRELKDTLHLGPRAATGRLLGTAIKGSAGAAVMLALSIDAFVP